MGLKLVSHIDDHAGCPPAYCQSESEGTRTTLLAAQWIRKDKMRYLKGIKLGYPKKIFIRDVCEYFGIVYIMETPDERRFRIFGTHEFIGSGPYGRLVDSVGQALQPLVTVKIYEYVWIK